MHTYCFTLSRNFEPEFFKGQMHTALGDWTPQLSMRSVLLMLFIDSFIVVFCWKLMRKLNSWQQIIHFLFPNNSILLQCNFSIYWSNNRWNQWFVFKVSTQIWCYVNSRKGVVRILVHWIKKLWPGMFW